MNTKFALSALLFSVAMHNCFTQTIQPESRFGSWKGAAKVRAKSQEYDLGCEIDVNFRLTLFTDGQYDVEILDYGFDDLPGQLCHIAAEGLWEAFLEENEVGFTQHRIFQSEGKYYLNLGLTGLQDDKLDHIKQEASRVEILHLDNRHLKIKIDLQSSSVKSRILLLQRE